MPPRKYTIEESIFLKENRSKYTIKELTSIFNEKFGLNKTAEAIDNYCKKHGYRAGSDGRFKKGHKTWIAGKKASEIRKHYKDEGSFRKGKFKPKVSSMAKKYKVGDEVYREPYIYIKVTESLDVRPEKQWMSKHRFVYEQNYGPIPEGSSVIFLDGDKTNFDPTNLAIVNRKEQGVLAGNDWYGKGEITRTAIAYAKLTNAIKEVRNGKR